MINYLGTTNKLTAASRAGDLGTVEKVIKSLDINDHANINYSLALAESGMNGHLNIVQYLLNVAKEQRLPIDTFESFKRACHRGHLAVVQYLLTNPEFKHLTVSHSKNLGLLVACEGGHLEVVKYLLASPDLTEHADINTTDDSPIRKACEGGYVEIVKYLLTSPELKKHSNINTGLSLPFRLAAKNGHLEVVKFLLDTQELNVNPHVIRDYVFRVACNNKFWDMVDYLILDYEIPLTTEIKEFVENNNKLKELLKTFNTRDLYHSINGKLKNNKKSVAKNKI